MTVLKHGTVSFRARGYAKEDLLGIAKALGYRNMSELARDAIDALHTRYANPNEYSFILGFNAQEVGDLESIVKESKRDSRTCLSIICAEGLNTFYNWVQKQNKINSPTGPRGQEVILERLYVVFDDVVAKAQHPTGRNLPFGMISDMECYAPEPQVPLTQIVKKQKTTGRISVRLDEKALGKVEQLVQNEGYKDGSAVVNDAIQYFIDVSNKPSALRAKVRLPREQVDLIAKSIVLKDKRIDEWIEAAIKEYMKEVLPDVYKKNKGIAA